MKLDANNNENKEYKIKGIYDKAIYTKKSRSGHLPGLYYLIFWKEYLKKKISRSFI